ncbi:MAG: LysR substrate-binding domain-containing protein [Pelagimonas sp.]|uniref:LysR substrate-binding domain-containing protein n=1 Tax=Pelagimonas sp. TaxID=2073170 RepID=UPI003D6BF747
MMERVPSLTQLRCFDAAARHQSFTACAQELGMTQSAVSKKIKELETDLGFDLFQRVGRGVVLTTAGRNLSEKLGQDLARLQDTLRQATSAGAGKDHVSIAILPTFANLWLIPKLPDFMRKHPNTEISLATQLDPFEFNRASFDLAIHYGSDNWPGTKMTYLFEDKMVPVCAPSFRDAYDLQGPENLTRVPLLHLSSRSDAWADWAEKSGLDIPARRNGAYFDQHSMVIAGAKAGLGAAIVPKDIVASELASGDLVRILGPELQTGKGYYLVRPAGQARQEVLNFEGWVLSQVPI